MTKVYRKFIDCKLKSMSKAIFPMNDSNVSVKMIARDLNISKKNLPLQSDFLPNL